MCLAQGHNAVTPVRLEPAAPRSRVKQSTTEPLRSHVISCFMDGVGIRIRNFLITKLTLYKLSNGVTELTNQPQHDIEKKTYFYFAKMLYG